MVENVVQQFIGYLYLYYTCISIIYQVYTPSTVLSTLCSLLKLILKTTQQDSLYYYDAIQPSHHLSSPSPPAPNPSQHQSLFQ